MASLADRAIRPLPSGTPALQGDALATLERDLGHGWTVQQGRLAKEFTFPDFAQALGFTNAVGAVAEAANHHPDISLTWGKVRVETWTHSIGGLSENDFILAARIETQRR